MKYSYNSRIKPVTISMASSLIQLQGRTRTPGWAARRIELIADKFYYNYKQTPSEHLMSKFKQDVMFWRYHSQVFGYAAYFIGTEEEVNNKLLVLSIHDE